MKVYHHLSKLALFLVLSLILVLPVVAQDNLSDDSIGDIIITFDGYVHFDPITGDITIDGFIIAPAGAIPPSLLSEGQYVVVTGKFLNDETFQLTDIDVDAVEPVDDPAPEATEEPSPEATQEPAPEATHEPSPEATQEPAPEATQEPAEEDEADTSCVPSTHPVANRIADEFGVSVETVIAMHCAGNGFGNITKAFILAEAANAAAAEGLADGEELDPMLLIDPQTYLDEHHGGAGWGQIIKESGLHPSDLAPGRRINGKKGNDEVVDDTSDDTTTTTTATSNTSSNKSNNGNGNGNGKNKDKSNNGNGNGNNGNGNGNGNGKGNKGGNGKNKNG